MLRLVPLLGLVAAKEGRLSSSPAANAFVDGLAKGEAGVIIEVGANTGAYSDKLMRRCQKAGLKVASLTLVDPQASMRPRLQRLAEEWKGEFVSAAATADEGNITFFTSRNSHVSSTLSSAASRYGLKSATVVPTVDRIPLATWNIASPPRLSLGLLCESRFSLHLTYPVSAWRAVSALIFRTIERAKTTHGAKLSVLLKLDVEGAEYDLLPHLLVRGALCLVDFLVIDWHLNSLPEARRLAGIGLRHSLGATVRGACTGRALQIEHEEFRPINVSRASQTWVWRSHWLLLTVPSNHLAVWNARAGAAQRDRTPHARGRHARRAAAPWY